MNWRVAVKFITLMGTLNRSSKCLKKLIKCIRCVSFGPLIDFCLMESVDTNLKFICATSELPHASGFFTMTNVRFPNFGTRTPNAKLRTLTPNSNTKPYRRNTSWAKSFGPKLPPKHCQPLRCNSSTEIHFII